MIFQNEVDAMLPIFILIVFQGKTPKSLNWLIILIIKFHNPPFKLNTSFQPKAQHLP